jgi:hypothetical protein
LDRVRDSVLGEISQVRDTQAARTDEVYKFSAEQIQILNEKVSGIRHDLHQGIQDVKEELKGGMDLDAESLKTFVL